MPRLPALRLALGLLLVLGSGQSTVAQDGPAWRTADGTIQVALGGKLHVDARGIRGGPGSVPSAFLVRRARVEAEVTVADRFRLVVEPGFGEGEVELVDGWGEAEIGGGLRVRAGRFKAPFGLESLRSSSDLRFAERALPTALSPRRDLGVMAHGAWAGGRVEAALGVFNGVPDGGSEDGERSEAKDAVGRVMVSPVAGLGVGLAAATGAERGTAEAPALADYETPAEQPFLRYADGVVADGRRQRVGPQAWLALGRLRADGEWTWAQHRVRGAEGTADLTHRAWQAAASVVLVGEPRGEERPHPVRAVTEGGPGAVEVSARIHGFTADAGTAPLAATESARQATAWGVAVQWTPVARVRLGATVERTVFEGFDDGTSFPAETVVALRAAFEI